MRRQNSEKRQPPVKETGACLRLVAIYVRSTAILAR